MRDESTDVREKAYRQAASFIPNGFKGQIVWTEIDNRSFLRIAHGYLLGLLHRTDGKAAKALAKKLLAWCPNDNLGVRLLMGDISLLTGDAKGAIKAYLKDAATSPAHWYQAALIEFRSENFVTACTYIRRGIAANPYIAEGLTGRTLIRKHLYWHASSQFGPKWAIDYLGAPVCDWSPQEIDFVDWIFNSSAVLHERTRLMELQEGVTYELDATRRQSLLESSLNFVDTVTDDLSKSMVKKYANRYGVEVWPWERAR
jgi:hypothetical protein